ncbi:MAG: helix-turn-helix domain-containing protein [Bacteroidota bacterium]
MSIGHRIRATREEQGLSQTEFSKRLNINQIEISRIERGRRKSFTPDLIIKISNVLNVHIEWLFTGKGAKKILYPEQVEEFLAQHEEELGKMTKEDLLLQQEQARAHLKKLERQLKSILQRINLDSSL